jgi:hypothetical protein
MVIGSGEKSSIQTLTERKKCKYKLVQKGNFALEKVISPVSQLFLGGEGRLTQHAVNTSM